MKMKKLTALLLAGLMAMSLVTSAFASDATITDASKGSTVKVTGSALVPTIKITAPSSTGVVLNPYGMKIKYNSGTWEKALADGTITAKVVSAVSNIVNLSDVSIKVGVTATGTVPAGVTFGKAAGTVAAIEGKDKQVYVELQMITADAVVSDADAFTETAVGTNKIVLATTAAKLATPIALAPSNDNVNAEAGGVLAFQFTGTTSKTPATPWSTNDKIGATLAFTFTPVDYVETFAIADGTVSGGTLSYNASAAAGDTVTVTATPTTTGQTASLTVNYTDSDNASQTAAVTAVDGEDNVFTFVMPAYNVSIDATFS